MKCKLITTGSDASKTKILEQSLIKHGWDYHFIIHEWRGFGDKILKTYEYLKANPDITHFFYSDSYDTIVVNTMEFALSRVRSLDGIVMSAERACYPHPDKAVLYPKCDSPFMFVNGGGWFCNSQAFIKAVDENPLSVETNDQVWFTDLFLKQDGTVYLDVYCNVFQTIAFCPEDNFEVTDKVYNTITKTYPVFIHGNGHTPLTKFFKTILNEVETIKQLEEQWKDTPEHHRAVHELFCDKVNADKKLKELRDYVEKNIFGFGERSFYFLFKLLTDTKTYDLKFLEIGVFRGQTLALMRMLKPKAKIVGITPLDSTDGHWESDYLADIKKLHDDFKLEQPRIIKGLSTDPKVIEQAGKDSYDIIYIDGGHTYEVAKSDVYTYSSMVKVGGYLIVDDCANKYNMEGMFKGIETVSKAVDELLPNEYYKEICSVVHIIVFQRIK